MASYEGSVEIFDRYGRRLGVADAALATDDAAPRGHRGDWTGTLTTEVRLFDYRHEMVVLRGPRDREVQALVRDVTREGSHTVAEVSGEGGSLLFPGA